MVCGVSLLLGVVWRGLSCRLQAPGAGARAWEIPCRADKHERHADGREQDHKRRHNYADAQPGERHFAMRGIRCSSSARVPSCGQDDRPRASELWIIGRAPKGLVEIWRGEVGVLRRCLRLGDVLAHLVNDREHPKTTNEFSSAPLAGELACSYAAFAVINDMHRDPRRVTDPPPGDVRELAVGPRLAPRTGLGGGARDGALR
jgi:hypothetical protein